MTKKSYLALGFLVLAAVLTVIGITQGQPAQVLTKAAAICLECVGLG